MTSSPLEDSHDAWRAINEPPPVADTLIEKMDRAIALAHEILAKLEERSKP